MIVQWIQGPWVDTAVGIGIGCPPKTKKTGEDGGDRNQRLEGKDQKEVLMIIATMKIPAATITTKTTVDTTEEVDVEGSRGQESVEVERDSARDLHHYRRRRLRKIRIAVILEDPTTGKEDDHIVCLEEAGVEVEAIPAWNGDTIATHITIGEIKSTMHVSIITVTTSNINIEINSMTGLDLCDTYPAPVW